MNKDSRYPLISVRNVIKMEKWEREVNFYWQKTNEIKNSSRRKETFFQLQNTKTRNKWGKRQKEMMTVGIADAVNKGKKSFLLHLFSCKTVKCGKYGNQSMKRRQMVRRREDMTLTYLVKHTQIRVFSPFRRLFNWQAEARFPRIRCHNQVLFLSCLINGPLCLKDLIRKQLFGCRFLCCVLKSNQAPITATTDLAKSTHVVWFTVMLVPSVAVERCPRRNGVRLPKLTEAIPRKSPFCHGLFGKYFPVAVVLSSEAKYSKGGIKIRTVVARKKPSVCCVAGTLQLLSDFPATYH